MNATLAARRLVLRTAVNNARASSTLLSPTTAITSSIFPSPPSSSSSSSSSSSCITLLMSSSMRKGLATKSDIPDPLPPAKAGRDDEIPSIFDQATGIERAEIEHPDLFKHNEVVRGPFGTEENPVKIQSHYDNRIVGCTGNPSPEDHDIVWMQVEKGEKSCCRECGQFFELDPL